MKALHGACMHISMKARERQYEDSCPTQMTKCGKIVRWLAKIPLCKPELSVQNKTRQTSVWKIGINRGSALMLGESRGKERNVPMRYEILHNDREGWVVRVTIFAQRIWDDPGPPCDWEIWGKMRLKAVVDFVSGAKKCLSKDGRTAGPRRSGTDNLGSTASRDTRNDESEIPAPKRKMLRSPAWYCGSPEVRMTVLSLAEDLKDSPCLRHRTVWRQRNGTWSASVVTGAGRHQSGLVKWRSCGDLRRPTWKNRLFKTEDGWEGAEWRLWRAPEWFGWEGS